LALFCTSLSEGAAALIHRRHLAQVATQQAYHSRRCRVCLCVFHVFAPGVVMSCQVGVGCYLAAWVFYLLKPSAAWSGALAAYTAKSLVQVPYGGNLSVAVGTHEARRGKE
jgi:hypothetical protein